MAHEEPEPGPDLREELPPRLPRAGGEEPLRPGGEDGHPLLASRGRRRSREERAESLIEEERAREARPRRGEPREEFLAARRADPERGGLRGREGLPVAAGGEEDAPGELPWAAPARDRLHDLAQAGEDRAVACVVLRRGAPDEGPPLD